MAHVLLVLAHILLAVVWIGLSLRLQTLARLVGSGELGHDDALRTAGTRTVQGMSVAIILFYVVAVANFLVGGGFSAYGPVYHTALTLGFGLVLVQVLLVQPAWTGLAAGDATRRGRVSMGIGIGHALWLILLVLMFFGPRWVDQWSV